MLCLRSRMQCSTYRAFYNTLSLVLDSELGIESLIGWKEHCSLFLGDMKLRVCIRLQNQGKLVLLQWKLLPCLPKKKDAYQSSDLFMLLQNWQSIEKKKWSQELPPNKSRTAHKSSYIFKTQGLLYIMIEHNEPSKGCQTALSLNWKPEWHNIIII